MQKMMQPEMASIHQYEKSSPTMPCTLKRHEKHHISTYTGLNFRLSCVFMCLYVSFLLIEHQISRFNLTMFIDFSLPPLIPKGRKNKPRRAKHSWARLRRCFDDDHLGCSAPVPGLNGKNVKTWWFNMV